MLKVMTFNIGFYGTRYGPWDERKTLVRDLIQEGDADIVALQAVRRDPQVAGGLDQAAQLARLLDGYEHVLFQPAMEAPDGQADGLAFLSKLRMTASDHLPLTMRPALEDTNQRAVLHARFDLSGGALHVYNAHFSWVRPQTELNLIEALPYLSTYPGQRLLVGDLNMTPDSDLLSKLWEAQWVDAWQVLHSSEPGYTFFEGDQPSKRIDYAWVDARLREQVAAIEVLGDQAPQAGLRPSDHAALLITLDMPQ